MWRCSRSQLRGVTAREEMASLPTAESFSWAFSGLVGRFLAGGASSRQVAAPRGRSDGYCCPVCAPDAPRDEKMKRVKEEK